MDPMETGQDFMSCETEPVRGPTGLEEEKTRGLLALAFFFFSVHERALDVRGTSA